MFKFNFITLFLIILIVTDSLAMKNQNNIPDTLLEHIDWSFSEPISSSSSEIVKGKRGSEKGVSTLL